jgi:hypothetical protein
VFECKDKKELETVVNECSLSFRVAHPSCMTTLAYAMNKMLSGNKSLDSLLIQKDARFISFFS